MVRNYEIIYKKIEKPHHWNEKPSSNFKFTFSCLLFILVACESSKNSDNNKIEEAIPKTVGKVQSLDDLQKTLEQIFSEDKINQAFHSTTPSPKEELLYTVFEATTTASPPILESPIDNQIIVKKQDFS